MLAHARQGLTELERAPATKRQLKRAVIGYISHMRAGDQWGIGAMSSSNGGIPSPFRFNIYTQHKKFRSGAHPNQMKQVKMILKAQEVYFESHNSAVHRHEDDMTNNGLTSNMGAQGTLLWVCHLGACHSS